jgi:hypothetical protein
MQDLGYELPRIPIPRTRVNKGARTEVVAVADENFGFPTLDTLHRGFITVRLDRLIGFAFLGAHYGARRN